MQEILNKIEIKITTMRATLVQLDQYGIHHESVNVIRYEMHFYINLLEMLKMESEKNDTKRI